jgi:hypothetical protein
MENCNLGSSLTRAIAEYIQQSVKENGKTLSDYTRDDWVEDPNKTRKGQTGPGYESSPVAYLISHEGLPPNSRPDHEINYALLGRVMLIKLVKSYGEFFNDPGVTEAGLHATDGLQFDGVNGRIKMELIYWNTATLKPVKMYKKFVDSDQAKLDIGDTVKAVQLGKQKKLNASKKSRHAQNRKKAFKTKLSLIEEYGSICWAAIMAMSVSGTTAGDRRTMNMIGRTTVSQIAQQGPNYGDVYRGTFHGVKIFILIILPDNTDSSKASFAKQIDSFKTSLWSKCDNTVRQMLKNEDAMRLFLPVYQDQEAKRFFKNIADGRMVGLSIVNTLSNAFTRLMTDDVLVENSVKVLRRRLPRLS